MKYVGIDEIWEKMPNKFVTIISASKEARRIIEAQKPPDLPKERDITQTEIMIAVPEIETAETAPKKRERKPKKPSLGKTETDTKTAKIETKAKVNPMESVNIEESRVSAEKLDENPYIAALNKVVRTSARIKKEPESGIQNMNLNCRK